jgi:hypothetical protein
LISLVVLLRFFRVMVRYSVGCYLLPTAYHDLFFLRNFQDTIWHSRWNSLLSPDQVAILDAYILSPEVGL